MATATARADADSVLVGFAGPDVVGVFGAGLQAQRAGSIRPRSTWKISR